MPYDGMTRGISMSYKIVLDSCGELPEYLKNSGVYENVALELEVDNCRIADDETFDQADFLKKIAASPNCPKSSCPSPEQYMRAYEAGGADHIYVVTITEQLSGSYNSARLAQHLFEEKYPDKKVYVFNSRSASVGETLIAMKAEELEKQGLPFEEVVEKTEEYIAGMNTYFILENLETLRKNGRLTGIKALVATALSIKPIMGATLEGTICQLGQARGINKALHKMVEMMEKELKNPEEKILAISHCSCYERALAVKEDIEKRLKFKDVLILDMRGVSTLYANDGGIIMCV